MQRDDSSIRGEADEPSSELERRVERVHALVQATAVRLSRCQAEQGNGGGPWRSSDAWGCTSKGHWPP